VVDVEMLGSGDIRPCLFCVVCGGRLRLESAWLAFPAVHDRQRQSSGKWIHRGCLNGNARQVFGVQRVTLWRAIELLKRLAQQVEPDSLI
jgi:hypothetical protein